jgi:hypothetical protein
MDEISRLEDDAAGDELAKQLLVADRARHAIKYLVKMGKRGEKAVLPYYHHHDRSGRGHAREILRELGTSNVTLVNRTLIDIEATDKRNIDTSDPFSDGRRLERRNSIAQELTRLKPVEDKQVNEKIAKGLARMLEESYLQLPDEALVALETWATPDCILAVEKACKDPNRIERAVKVLAKFKDDERVIESLARLLASSERDYVVKALVSIGPKVEDTVLLQLDHPDAPTRRAAVQVLAEVGTKKSLKPLERVAKVESERLNLVSMKTARQKILAREKKGGKK